MSVVSKPQALTRALEIRPVVDQHQRFEMLLHLLEELVEENEATPILVEGQRDVAALRALGFSGEIVALKQAVSVAGIAHELAKRVRRVILLPDWDDAGLALRDLAEAQLSSHGVRVDVRYHERLVRDTELAMKDVETLPAYVARGLTRHRRMSLERYLLARRGDPLGVETIRRDFEPPAEDASSPPTPPPRRGRHKRRARPRD